jgi:diguanylate cyclase (GGDEF)-like protein/PAS domain S-box-containing protein
MTERARQTALESLRILDSDPEPFFDALTRAAHAMTGMPVAMISLIDGDRQWFKAQVGLEAVSETARDISFCTWAIQSDMVLEVPDARQDLRFADNPIVVGPPFVRHYLGAPIRLEGGSRIGTLCLLNPAPGLASAGQREALAWLARVAAIGMEQRASLLNRIADSNRLHRQLQRSQAFLERTNTLARVGGWELTLGSNALDWTRETRLIHGVAENFDPNIDAALSFYPDPSRAQLEAAIAACAADGSAIDLTVQATKAGGERGWVHIVGQRVEDAVGARLIGAIQDVTEQRSATDALAHSEARYRRLFQHSLGLICTHTLDGVITSVNPAASLSLGRPEAELLGRSLTDIIPVEKQAHLQYYLQRIAENQSDSGLMELVAEDGSRRYWAYHNVLDTEADPPYVLGHAQDITTQHLQERQLLEMAIRDPLTRAFNRRYLAELAQNQLDAWGCLVFDLDHFKEINDSQGHAHGDAVLVEFVAFLSVSLQEDEVVVRLGGDEFLVFVPGATLERLQELEMDYQARVHLAPVRFSGGCAINRPSETVADTINRADMKLYERRRKERRSNG